jgi:hypothetical protein
MARFVHAPSDSGSLTSRFSWRYSWVRSWRAPKASGSFVGGYFGELIEAETHFGEVR